MIPKAYYGLLYSFLSLVAASPVALQERQEGTTPEMGIAQQTIPSGGKPWSVYGSHLTFDAGADITEKHLVSIAKAAHQEMIDKAQDNSDIPNVMTALKVGNEVFLSSNMKGGGGVYIYKEQEGLMKDKPKKDDNVVENGYGAFTEVLEKHAPDVKGALDNLRAKSREHGFGQEQSKTEAQLKGSKSQEQPSRTSGGRGNQNNRQDSSRSKEQKTKQQKNKESQTLKKAGETTYQHKNDANCGEVMASLRYRMVHTGQENQLRNKKNPQPTVVSTTADKGKIILREPCAKTRTVDSDECALGWGCGAFVGPDGMNFHVVEKDETDANIPKFESNEVPLPTPAAKPTEGGSNNNKGGNKNSNTQPGSSTGGNKNSNTQPGSSTKNPPKKSTGKGRGH